MSNKIRSAFAGVRMDPACANKIENALNQGHTPGGYAATPHRESRRSGIFAAAAMACLLALTIFGGSALMGTKTPAEATDVTGAETPTETLSPSEAEEIRKMNEEHQEKVDRIRGYVRVREHSNGNFLKPSGQKLYFNANNEIIDITDVISDDKAFTYVYTEDGIIHYIAVGGTYVPGVDSLDTVYYGYWYKDADYADEPLLGWVAGNCKGHWSNAKNDYFGWYLEACEVLGIPWRPDLGHHEHDTDHHHE